MIICKVCKKGIERTNAKTCSYKCMGEWYKKLKIKPPSRQGIEPWNKGKKLPQWSGEKNGVWKGSSIKYGSLHDWVQYHLGQPNKCEHCGITVAKKFEWANKSRSYKKDLSDWIRLCVSCHHKYDNIMVKIWQTRRTS